MPANVGSMAYVGEVPWHGLGVQLGEPMTAKEAIEKAKLDWTVSRCQLYLGDGAMTPVADHYAVVRDDIATGDPKRVLGIVGKQFTALQNVEAFSFFDPIVEEGAAIYHVAGCLGKGEIVWILAKLPKEILIADQPIHKYLLLANGHDGTLSVHVKFTPIRVICQNTLFAALGEGRNIVIRHTRSVKERVQQAHELLGITNRYYDQLEVAFCKLAKHNMTETNLVDYLEAVFPLPRDKNKQKPVLKARTECHRLFRQGAGNNADGVRGTWWAAYNGVAEYIDHHRKTSGAVRLESIWFGGGATVKARAFDVAMKMAGVSVN